MPKRARRGRGEGSVRWLEKKKLWTGQVRFGAGQKRKTVYGQTKDEVLRKIRKLQSQGPVVLPQSEQELASGRVSYICKEGHVIVVVAVALSFAWACFRASSRRTLLLSRASSNFRSRSAKIPFSLPSNLSFGAT